MPILQAAVENYGDDYISVLARSEGLRAPRHVDIDTSLYPVQKIFRPGRFVGTIPASTKARLLPRAVVTANTTTAQNTVTVATGGAAAIFVVGDVLTLINADGTAGAAVGTVASVNPTTGVITLGANSVTALTAGTSLIGVATSVPIGMICPNTVIDFGLRSNSHFGVFTGASVYKNRMPHWDAHLKSKFPDIILVDDYT